MDGNRSSASNLSCRPGVAATSLHVTRTPKTVLVRSSMARIDAERRHPAPEEPRDVPHPGMDQGEPTTVTHEFEDDPQTSTAAAPPPALPKRIGRYRIERLLGRGGFGLVYLAQDEQLNRPVAVKVPHPNLVARPEDADLYLTEARTVASLEHPHIVPVYDVGGTTEFPFFVVSKYVEGTDLATRLKKSRLFLVAGG